MIYDKKTKVIELKELVNEFVEARNWHKYHNPKDIAISIIIEASELMELFQFVSESDICLITQDPHKFLHLKEELADVMIYCLSLANTLNVDITQAITDKINSNKAKYPVEKVKGNYKKYTEL